MQLFQEQKTFSEFVSAFFKARLNIERFQKKMTLIADAFPILRNPKNEVKQISKKSPLRESSGKQHLKGTKNWRNIN